VKASAAGFAKVREGQINQLSVSQGARMAVQVYDGSKILPNDYLDSALLEISPAL